MHENKIKVASLIFVCSLVLGIAFCIIDFSLFSIVAYVCFGIAVVSAGVGIYFSSKQYNLEQEQEEKEYAKEIERKNQEKQEYTKWLQENYSAYQPIVFRDSIHSWYMRETVVVDEEKKVIIFGKEVIKFEDIVGAEPITYTTQSVSAQTQKSNPVGRAVVGGILAGGVGAVVGAVSAKETSKTDITTITDVVGVTVYLTKISQPKFEYRSSNYNDNKKVYSTLLAIIANNERNK